MLLNSIQASFFQAQSTNDPSAIYRDLVEAILKEYGPKLSQLLIRGIGGEAARSELDVLADPLKKMVFSQPRAKAWLSDALFSNSFPSSKVGNDEKRLWLQRIMR